MAFYDGYQRVTGALKASEKKAKNIAKAKAQAKKERALLPKKERTLLPKKEKTKRSKGKKQTTDSPTVTDIIDTVNPV